MASVSGSEIRKVCKLTAVGTRVWTQGPLLPTFALSTTSETWGIYFCDLTKYLGNRYQHYGE